MLMWVGVTKVMCQMGKRGRLSVTTRTGAVSSHSQPEVVDVWRGGTSCNQLQHFVGKVSDLHPLCTVAVFAFAD